MTQLWSASASLCLASFHFGVAILVPVDSAELLPADSGDSGSLIQHLSSLYKRDYKSWTSGSNAFANLKAMEKSPQDVIAMVGVIRLTAFQKSSTTFTFTRRPYSRESSLSIYGFYSIF